MTIDNLPVYSRGETWTYTDILATKDEVTTGEVNTLNSETVQQIKKRLN